MDLNKLEEMLEMAKIIDIMDGIAKTGQTCILRISKKGGYNLTMGSLKCKGKTNSLLLENMHKVIREINTGVKDA